MPDERYNKPRGSYNNMSDERYNTLGEVITICQTKGIIRQGKL